MSTILIRGPFTEVEMAGLVTVLSGIEAARPEETFEIFIDHPDADTEIEALVEKINPLRPGYERVVRYRDVDTRDAP
jgi:hypothetical protein